MSNLSAMSCFLSNLSDLSTRKAPYLSNANEPKRKKLEYEQLFCNNIPIPF